MVAKKDLKVLMQRPTKDQLAIIQQELNEDDGKTEHVEELIQKWIDLQPFFPKNIDKTMIRNSIKFSKHNLEKAKKKIENYLTAKTCYPEIFSNREPDSPEIDKVFETVNIVFTPKLTDKGSRISYFLITDNNIDNFKIDKIERMLFMIIDMALCIDSPIASEIAVFDTRGVTAAHLPKIISIFKKATHIIRESYTFRLKQVHVVNPLPLVETLVNTLKPFLHRKVRENVYVHKDFKSLHQHIEPNLLPSTYGGSCPATSELSAQIKTQLCNMKDWFAQQESVKFNGTIPNKVKHNLYADTQLGVEGSFRKLEID